MPKILSHPRPNVAKALDQYRHLKAHVMFWMHQEPKTLLLTSAERESGTTTALSNLAVLLAHSGYRVLLIDACFKHPQLHRNFRILNVQGLTTILAQGTQSTGWDAVIMDTPIPNVWLLPSGPLSANAAELFEPLLINELFTALKRRYDLILIDAPPVLDSADTLILSALVDGVLLIIPSGTHPRSVHLKAIHALQQAHAPVIGSILTQFSE